MKPTTEIVKTFKKYGVNHPVDDFRDAMVSALVLMYGGDKQIYILNETKAEWRISGVYLVIIHEPETELYKSGLAYHIVNAYHYNGITNMREAVIELVETLS